MAGVWRYLRLSSLPVPSWRSASGERIGAERRYIVCTRLTQLFKSDRLVSGCNGSACKRACKGVPHSLQVGRLRWAGLAAALSEKRSAMRFYRVRVRAEKWRTGLKNAAHQAADPSLIVTSQDGQATRQQVRAS
jgi:hypothetical protein